MSTKSPDPGSKDIRDDRSETVSLTYTVSTEVTGTKEQPKTIKRTIATQTDTKASADLPPALPVPKRLPQQKSAGQQRGRMVCRSSSGSWSEGDARASTTRVFEQYKVTPDATLKFAIDETLAHFNFPYEDASCCLWHSALDYCARALHKFKKGKCRKDWAVCSEWQCEECAGLNAHGDDSCDTCGGLKLDDI